MSRIILTIPMDPVQVFFCEHGSHSVAARVLVSWGSFAHPAIWYVCVIKFTQQWWVINVQKGIQKEQLHVILNYFGLLGKLQEINDDLDNLADAVAAGVALEKAAILLCNLWFGNKVEGFKFKVKELVHDFSKKLLCLQSMGLGRGTYIYAWFHLMD